MRRDDSLVHLGSLLASLLRLGHVHVQWCLCLSWRRLGRVESQREEQDVVRQNDRYSK